MVLRFCSLWKGLLKQVLQETLVLCYKSVDNWWGPKLTEQLYFAQCLQVKRLSYGILYSVTFDIKCNLLKPFFTQDWIRLEDCAEWSSLWSSWLSFWLSRLPLSMGPLILVNGLMNRNAKLSHVKFVMSLLFHPIEVCSLIPINCLDIILRQERVL